MKLVTCILLAAAVLLAKGCNHRTDGARAAGLSLPMVPALVVEGSEYDAGIVIPGTPITNRFYVVNNTRERIRIVSMNRSCGVSSVELSTFDMEPQAREWVDVSTNDTLLPIGEAAFTVQLISTASPFVPAATLRMTAFIGPVVEMDVQPRTFTFSAVDGHGNGECAFVAHLQCSRSSRIPAAERWDIDPELHGLSVDSIAIADSKLVEGSTSGCRYTAKLRLDYQLLEGDLHQSVWVIASTAFGPAKCAVEVRGLALRRASLATDVIFIGSGARGEPFRVKLPVEIKAQDGWDLPSVYPEESVCNMKVALSSNELDSCVFLCGVRGETTGLFSDDIILHSVANGAVHLRMTGMIR